MTIGKLALTFAAGALMMLPGAAASQEAEAEAEETLSRSDPNYIRCQTRRVTGSNARRERICMTNRQWDRMARHGNDDAENILGYRSRQSGIRGCASPDGC
ncbi:MAG: hypothetical protein ACTS1Z_15475 [Parasphingopyxis sp.]|uniref:hypothetical protein n=1 Tax=Parasphingopyxis sp. TaxID=1920299 RepID=UPI003FA0B5A9